MKWVIIFIMMTACGTEENSPSGEPSPSPSPKQKVEIQTKTTTEDEGGDETIVVAEPTPEPTPEPFTAWVDPLTDREWLIVGAGDAVDAMCEMGYEVPDIFDLQEAEANGLADEFVDRDIDTRIWTKNLSDGVIESWRRLTDTTEWLNTLVDGFVLCVEES